MSDAIIETGPAFLMQGNGENQHGAVLQHAAQFPEHLLVVFGVLNDIKGADQAEFAVPIRQRGDFTRDRVSAASIQSLDCRRADVEKMGAGNGQARAQTGTDFQTHRRFRKQP